MRCTVLVLFTLLSAQVLARDTLPGPVPGWREVVFEGRTLYSLDPEHDCIRAEARGTASGLVRQLEAADQAGLLLRWQWRAEAPLVPSANAPEKRRGGDDFLARVYVIHEGRFFWQTRAVNYVWSREQATGTVWPNPFTGNAIMVAVQSGEDGLGEWRSFERDVRADFRRYHDIDITRVSAVAIMTDADNTQGQASACYRLPRFGGGPP